MRAERRLGESSARGRIEGARERAYEREYQCMYIERANENHEHTTEYIKDITELLSNVDVCGTERAIRVLNKKNLLL